MGMFDNFTPTEISYNLPDYHYIDNTSDVIIGATNTHVFKQPFLFTNYIKSFEVIYRQGLTEVLTKIYDMQSNEENNNNEYRKDIIIHECDKTGNTIVKVILSPEESTLFKNSVLECQVQLKFYLLDDSILYSDCYDIRVKSPLDDKNLF